MKLTLFWWSSHYGCILDSSLKNPDADERCQILQLLIPSSPRTLSSTGIAWTSAPLPVDHTSFVPSLGWSRSVPISIPPSKLISVTNFSRKPPLTSYPPPPVQHMCSYCALDTLPAEHILPTSELCLPGQTTWPWVSIHSPVKPGECLHGEYKATPRSQHTAVTRLSL